MKVNGYPNTNQLRRSTTQMGLEISWIYRLGRADLLMQRKWRGQGQSFYSVTAGRLPTLSDMNKAMLLFSFAVTPLYIPEKLSHPGTFSERFSLKNKSCISKMGSFSNADCWKLGRWTRQSITVLFLHLHWSIHHCHLAWLLGWVDFWSDAVRLFPWSISKFTL